MRALMLNYKCTLPDLNSLSLQIMQGSHQKKSKNGAVVKHQRTFVLFKTTSILKRLFKSGDEPLYCSLVTSL